MSAPSVQVETRGSVARITLNRPENANTIDLQMAMDLLAAAMTCSHNNAVRAAVLTGSGRNFCFGGDLRAIASEGVDGGYLRVLSGFLLSAVSLFVRLVSPVF